MYPHPLKWSPRRDTRTLLWLIYDWSSRSVKTWDIEHLYSRNKTSHLLWPILSVDYQVETRDGLGVSSSPSLVSFIVNLCKGLKRVPIPMFELCFPNLLSFITRKIQTITIRHHLSPNGRCPRRPSGSFDTWEEAQNRLLSRSWSPVAVFQKTLENTDRFVSCKVVLL